MTLDVSGKSLSYLILIACVAGCGSGAASQPVGGSADRDGAARDTTVDDTSGGPGGASAQLIDPSNPATASSGGAALDGAGGAGSEGVGGTATSDGPGIGGGTTADPGTGSGGLGLTSDPGAAGAMTADPGAGGTPGTAGGSTADPPAEDGGSTADPPGVGGGTTADPGTGGGTTVDPGTGGGTTVDPGTGGGTTVDPGTGGAGGATSDPGTGGTTSDPGTGGTDYCPPGDSTLNGVLRDFKEDHPDFEDYIGEGTPGLVEDVLGPDGKPVYTGLCDASVTYPNENCPYDQQMTTQADFDQWYRDVPGVNLTTTHPLVFRQNGDVCTYHSSAFFPIDNQLWGNEGNANNSHFTMEFHADFAYRGGEVFRFSGDDDVWVFVNGILALDLGGMHHELGGEIDFDQAASDLGLEVGGVYTLDFFYAERHTTESNLWIDMNLAILDCYGNPIFGEDGLGCLPPCTELATAWAGTSCDICSTATQSDQLQCRDFLDCYLANSCGPDQCGDNDDICGVNAIGGGGGAKEIADQVFRCVCNSNS